MYDEKLASKCFTELQLVTIIQLRFVVNSTTGHLSFMITMS